MTELEKIQYAKEFIDKMANGINPLDDTPISDGDILNNVRLSRCMFYVSDILRQVIENGGVTKPKKTRKIPFSLTEEQKNKYELSAYPLPASEIAKRINSLIDTENMEKITYKLIVSWLLKIGMLCQKETFDGRVKKYPTDIGMELGIICEKREGQRGEYEVILYNRAAQQFILDNLDAIMSLK